MYIYIYIYMCVCVSITSHDILPSPNHFFWSLRPSVDHGSRLLHLHSGSEMQTSLGWSLAENAGECDWWFAETFRPEHILAWPVVPNKQINNIYIYIYIYTYRYNMYIYICIYIYNVSLHIYIYIFIYLIFMCTIYIYIWFAPKSSKLTLFFSSGELHGAACHGGSTWARHGLP